MGVIDQLSYDEQRIWHTYLCQARMLTRRYGEHHGST